MGAAQLTSSTRKQDPLNALRFFWYHGIRLENQSTNAVPGSNQKINNPRIPAPAPARMLSGIVRRIVGRRASTHAENNAWHALRPAKIKHPRASPSRLNNPPLTSECATTYKRTTKFPMKKTSLISDQDRARSTNCPT